MGRFKAKRIFLLKERGEIERGEETGGRRIYNKQK